MEPDSMILDPDLRKVKEGREEEREREREREKREQIE
jgi:hypothetical protein